MKLRIALALARALNFAVPASAQSPEGLWIYSAPTQPERAMVEIERVDGTWSGTINGVRVPVTQTGAIVTMGEAGGLRFAGKTAPDGGPITGHVTQPANGFGYAPMETRMALNPLGDARWAGTSAIQPRPCDMYQEFFTDDDGVARAAIRDPQRNEMEGARSFRIEPHADVGAGNSSRAAANGARPGD